MFQTNGFRIMVGLLDEIHQENGKELRCLPPGPPSCRTTPPAGPVAGKGDLVDETPSPWFVVTPRGDDRVPRAFVVTPGMTVLGSVATPNVTARQADAEVDPLGTHLETLLTTV